ncbi:MAG: class I SAM-dependent methyltransferase [Flavisolibacter sp.]|nr:class I SAM-dependent methyltransferase [Flavisolibacter sp.]
MNNSTLHTKFEQQYISLRQKEGRLYTDEEVKRLPVVHHKHPLKKEWVARKKSCDRLIHYLLQKRKPLNILEIGCGNGWLCHQLSKIPDTSITGIDINELELNQAKRVFPALSFLYGDLREGITTGKFDVIVFAASFQYFDSVDEILQCCFEHLKENGEIHIIDTHFYSREASVQARIRSCEYFASKGIPEMSKYYFHHALSELDGFNYTVLYDPKKLFNKLFGRNPFRWICIRK